MLRIKTYLNKIRRKITSIDREYLLLTDLDNTINSLVDPKYLIKKATLDEVKMIYLHPECGFQQYPSPWEPLEKKILDGTWKCILAIDKDELMGYSFYSEKMIELMSIKMVLPKKSIYRFKDFVRPKYRNQKVQKALQNYISQTVKYEGYDKVFCFVSDDNPISYANQLKTGAIQFSQLYFINFLFINRIIIPKKMKDYGFKVLNK